MLLAGPTTTGWSPFRCLRSSIWHSGGFPAGGDRRCSSKVFIKYTLYMAGLLLHPHRSNLHPLVSPVLSFLRYGTQYQGVISRRYVHVANMASYAISLSLILVIHDNMINETNHIVQHVFVDTSRSQGCKNITCQNEKIKGQNWARKEKEKTPSDEPTVP
jgi:hypothetical protein